MIKPRMEWATSYFSCQTQKCHNQMDMFVANYPRISQQYTIGALLVANGVTQVAVGYYDSYDIVWPG